MAYEPSELGKQIETLFVGIAGLKKRAHASSPSLGTAIIDLNIFGFYNSSRPTDGSRGHLGDIQNALALGAGVPAKLMKRLRIPPGRGRWRHQGDTVTIAHYKPTSTRAPADRKGLTSSWLLNINKLLPNVG
jgi:hypothetical protein